MPSSLGQGAGVSMLNAVEMADMATDAPDVPAGLAAWEGKLRPVVEQWQRRAEAVAIGRALSDAVHPGEDLPAERPEAIPMGVISEPAL
jgi:2-methyl-3-hydroxypyridine 5-carboxylic acid dioxygenase